ncbi:sigma-70 family RNA polymerase sigma factor [Streptomyces sp. AM 2-1-1]|uniref:sigma-70 family RNA polymerase sigma factor n=1 Tax=Streptomyces sp. AM 2-1-1 TaxID=3028709 RepID=UPI0023B92E1E|nr:sigma-70 family RNA polymerase sigma factor [Streptomyces sp. AM 2-1-1]WEH40752.1 sigma-70 family RNA polymerase sigma factor [Streptomyces sp. AM 2-1-1]
MTTQASPKITPPGAGQEPELLVLARNGDRDAFASLYNEHAPEVARYIRVRVCDAYLAEDLVQETFLRALGRISTFTWQGRNFGAWLVTIARNLITDHLRSARARLETVVGDILDADTTVDSAETAGLRVLATAEAVETVRTALLKLTPEQAGALQLRFLGELSIAETATAMGRTEGSIKLLTHRGMASLRTRMAVAA